MYIYIYIFIYKYIYIYVGIIYIYIYLYLCTTKFSIKYFFSTCKQFLADLLTITKQILNGKLGGDK